MKRLVLATLILAVGIIVARAADSSPVYELRIYTTNPGKMPGLLTRFRDHTCAIFERHGMVNVGYWLPADPADSNRLFYLLKHPSREQAAKHWKEFAADPEWQQVQKASEANGKLVTKVDSTFLEPADYTPPLAVPAGSGHAFELRIYTTNEGKLPALDARFRDHTIGLFRRHGIESVFYSHPLDVAQGAGNTLIYLLVHPDRATAAKNWAAFQADPEWITVRTESEKAGKLLVPPGPKSTFLTPTDFSPMK
ncbi:MAG TPA: NIPSNAP family protein [Candidatus Didemnitutus sp.]|nr:NIPSNAP family protein [Candidatus Didemnitutus sp.]